MESKFWNVFSKDLVSFDDEQKKDEKDLKKAKEDVRQKLDEVENFVFAAETVDGTCWACVHGHAPLAFSLVGGILYMMADGNIPIANTLCRSLEQAMRVMIYKGVKDGEKENE